MIDCFDGSYAFLSNFYESPFTWKSMKYPTVEHAFQAAKTMNPMDSMKIIRAETPGKAKRLGRKVSLRPDWEEVKERIMYECVYAKFHSSEGLMLALLGTGDEELVEGTSWHDNEWGNCSCPQCQSIEGKNKLGKILMRVREEIKEELKIEVQKNGGVRVQ